MTNSEAIAVLMEQKRYVHENSVPDQALDMGIKALKNERKKGKWIEKWNGHFKTDVPRCSLCSNASPFKYNYCPTCGADMGRKEDAETD